MEADGDNLYLVQFGNGEKHLVAEESEVGELLAEKMEDPRGYYARLLERKHPELLRKEDSEASKEDGSGEDEEPIIVKLGFSPDFFNCSVDWGGDVTIKEEWTYKYIPYWALFGEKNGNREHQNQEGG
ncbi:hypothetical protein AKJ39_01260 [candidate division MSBL1 archaeon SCGC-AAA259J03]|uniref:Uncharacterized protein n=1 Tax=candidate division MSBL1 archaeon SCGC-AAA259J03 TaxID=1698269 RepID=A0A656YWT2_9EURY|nr:hypothetical protein AKJ39_01260 [candidate division MSBL1 archaeon SCGC-AAA259J03]